MTRPTPWPARMRLDTDTWTSMGQEAEAEIRQAFAAYQVNDTLMSLAKPGRSSCTASRHTVEKR